MKISFLSLGNHFKKNILNSVLDCDFIEPIGVFTRNEILKEEFSKSLKCKKYLREEELFLDLESKFVYISSPNSIHYDQISKAINAKKSVIVEKPIFVDLSEASELIPLSKKHGLLLHEGMMYKHHSQFKKIKEILKNETYGNLKKASFSFGFPHLDKNNIRYKKSLKGGAKFDAGIYAISAAHELFGSEYEVLSANSFYEKSFEVDTSGIILLKYENFIVELNWFFGAAYKNQAEFWFEDAHLIAEMFFSKPRGSKIDIKIIRNYELVSTIKFDPENQFKEMFKYFNSCTNKQYLNDLNNLKMSLNLLSLLNDR